MKFFSRRTYWKKKKLKQKLCVDFANEFSCFYILKLRALRICMYNIYNDIMAQLIYGTEDCNSIIAGR